MSYEMEGVLHKKYDTESKTQTFQAREFVVKTEETYPQFIKFQLTQDRCGLMDQYNDGDKLKVHFDLRGREWNEKFFTNLQAWKIEAVAQAAPAGGPVAAPVGDNSFPATEYPTVDAQVNKAKAEDFDDLPF